MKYKKEIEKKILSYKIIIWIVQEIRFTWKYWVDCNGYSSTSRKWKWSEMVERWEKKNTKSENWFPQEVLGCGWSHNSLTNNVLVVSFWPALTVYHIPYKPIESRESVWSNPLCMRFPFPVDSAAYNHNHA